MIAGTYQPDLHSQFGSQVALRMIGNEPLHEDDNTIAAMLERQRREMGYSFSLAST